MKKVPLKFNKHGFVFEQLKRENNIAIYKQIEDDVIVGLEVVKIQTAKRDYKPFKIKTGDESYPHTNMWGTEGWSYGVGHPKYYNNALERANKKFDNLIDKSKKHGTE